MGLYSNIPHTDMLTSLQHFMDTRPPTNAPPTETVVEVVGYILQNNFSFEGETSRQDHGPAMGMPMAPMVANLFMGWMEETTSIDSSFWKRFIDDILLLWVGMAEELEVFNQHLSSFHPTMKFTLQSSPSQLPSLDILLNLEEGYIHR